MLSIVASVCVMSTAFKGPEEKREIKSIAKGRPQVKISYPSELMRVLDDIAFPNKATHEKKRRASQEFIDMVKAKTKANLELQKKGKGKKTPDWYWFWFAGIPNSGDEMVPCNYFIVPWGPGFTPHCFQFPVTYWMCEIKCEIDAYKMCYGDPRPDLQTIVSRTYLEWDH